MANKHGTINNVLPIYGRRIFSFNDIGDDPADNFKITFRKGHIVRGLAAWQLDLLNPNMGYYRKAWDRATKKHLANKGWRRE